MSIHTYPTLKSGINLKRAIAGLNLRTDADFAELDRNRDGIIDKKDGIIMPGDHDFKMTKREYIKNSEMNILEDIMLVDRDKDKILSKREQNINPELSAKLKAFEEEFNKSGLKLPANGQRPNALAPRQIDVAIEGLKVEIIR